MLHVRYTLLLGSGLALACGSANSDGLFADASLTSNSGSSAGGAQNSSAGSAGTTSGSGGSSQAGIGGSAGSSAAGQNAGGAGGMAGGSGGTEGNAGSSEPDAGAPDPDASTPADAAATDAATETCVATADATEICDGVDNDCDGQIDPGTTCSDSCRGFALVGSRYMFCASVATMSEAETLCEANQQRLAWIESELENTELTNALAAMTGLVGLPTADAQRATWLGGTDGPGLFAEDTWRWVASPGFDTGAFTFWDDGPNGEYENWASGEPNDQGTSDCIRLLVLSGANGDASQWADIDCDTDLSYLCEVPDPD